MASATRDKTLQSRTDRGSVTAAGGPAYAAMLGDLFAVRRFGMVLGLERMRRALTLLGHPERRLGRVVHVAGTNGKGSTAAFIEAAVRAAGLRTGLYTSPHLARFTERFRIDGLEVSPDQLAARFGAMRETLAAARAAEPEVLELTFFEQATLLGLLVLGEAGLDVTVLEVGLGGRLDATNAVAADVAVVTGVSLDHQDILGPDLLGIAREKAGIFKAGRAAVVGVAGEVEARPTIVAEARRAGAAEIVIVGEDAPAEPPADWQLGLRGGHQRRNAACALAALDALERVSGGGLRIPAEARRAGLSSARWPARLELLAGGQAEAPVLLDAAHNPEGAAALAAELDAPELAPRGAPVVVVGVSADKDVDGVLAPVVGRARRVIATEGLSARAMPASELAARIGRAQAAGRGAEAGTTEGGVNGASGVLAEPDPAAALAMARSLAGEGGLVVVYGSIFLVGPLRARLLGEGLDPVAAQDPVGVRR